MRNEYDYESNEDGNFDILDPNGDIILGDLEEEDEVIALVEELNNPSGGCYSREDDESDPASKVSIYNYEDRLLVKTATVAEAEGFLSHLNRDD